MVLPNEAAAAGTPSTRVLVVDDHEVVRAGLQAALTRETAPDGVAITVVGSAATGREALALCGEMRPDVAVIDARLPDVGGDEVCRRVRAQCPEVAVVMLSSYLDEASVRSAVAAGASAYVTKAAGLAELRSAIVEAHGRGGSDPDRPSVSRIVRHLEALVAEREGTDAPTPAQKRVLALAAQGLTYTRIARDLRISESTVRFHIQRLKVKLGVQSRTELAVAAVRAGLVESPEVEARPEATVEASR